jgi:serine/threonine protein kinase
LERLKKSDPDSIGPWKLISRLGSGGMSVVYLASKSNKTSVALKVIRSQYLDNQADRNRIEREISTLTNIKSKYVCQILDSDISEDFAWIATEFIDGPDLKTKVLEDGPLDEKSWYELAKGLLEGLDAIHRNKVVHRDIKPSNILISEAGPKIIDFGIAQTSEATSLTSTGLIAGSPAWLSPEQINGDKVTYSADFFSAGAVLNFAVSGISPWGDNTKITKDVIYNRILQKQPDLSSLNSLQKSLVEKMMHKDPKSRPSADQALQYLNDKWSEEAKLKKQIEEEERQREKEEKQKKEELAEKRRKNRQTLRKVILEPLLIRRKIISLALASVFILASTGTYAFTSYSSKTGVFKFLADSASIEIESPENIIADPPLTTLAPSVPVVTDSPTPDQTSKTSLTPSKQSEAGTTTETRIEICRTITQFGESKQCFNESQFHEITVQDLYQDCPWYAFKSGCEIGSKVIMPINRDLVTLPCVSYGDTLVRTGSIGVTLGAGGIRKSDYCTEKSNGTLPYSLNGFMPLSFFNPKEVSTGFSSLPAFGVEIFDEYKTVKVKVNKSKIDSTNKSVNTVKGEGKQICRTVIETATKTGGVEQVQIEKCWYENQKAKIGPCLEESRDYFARGDLIKNGQVIEVINISHSHISKDKSMTCKVLPLPFTPGTPMVDGYRALDFPNLLFDKSDFVDSINWTISGGVSSYVTDYFR